MPSQSGGAGFNQHSRTKPMKNYSKTKGTTGLNPTKQTSLSAVISNADKNNNLSCNLQNKNP